MYTVLRMILGCVFLLIPLVFLKIFKVMKKNRTFILLFILSIIIMTASTFIPFENSILTFNTPDEVYRYYSFKSNNVLIVEGSNSALVIDWQNNKDSYYMVPKVSQGWKIGLGTDMKSILHTIVNELFVDVYQYKNSDDYYICINHISGDSLFLSDEYQTEFHSLKRIDYSGKEIFSYYACIHSVNPEYTLDINGTNIIIPMAN